MVSMRYETLWGNLGLLGKYLGIRTKDYPKYRKRRTDWNRLPPEQKALLKKTYGRLANKIESAKDFKIW